MPCTVPAAASNVLNRTFFSISCEGKHTGAEFMLFLNNGKEKQKSNAFGDAIAEALTVTRFVGGAQLVGRFEFIRPITNTGQLSSARASSIARDGREIPKHIGVYVACAWPKALDSMCCL
jgi:hypothetical protein